MENSGDSGNPLMPDKVPLNIEDPIIESKEVDEESQRPQVVSPTNQSNKFSSFRKMEFQDGESDNYRSEDIQGID